MVEKDIIYDFLKNILETRLNEIKYSFKSYEFSESLLEKARAKLNKINSLKQKEIVSLVSTFNSNQLALFLETFKYDLDYSKDFSNLLQNTREIKKGRFSRKVSSLTIYSKGCINTYTGFMRALEAGTLYTAKIKINGKLKRVFVKTPIGDVGVNKATGFFRLLIDPETMDVYSFKSRKSGKINDSELIKVYTKEDLKNDLKAYHYDAYAQNVQKNYNNFKKALLDRIDAVYGLERVVDTFLRMGGKINPDKYSNPEFREEMIHYLKEKFGTDKLLRWSSKIKDPKKAAETKLEILKVLAKKYGPDYAKFYSLKTKEATKVIKPQRTKPKPRNIRRI